jgi:hypothetical protein
MSKMVNQSINLTNNRLTVAGPADVVADLALFPRNFRSLCLSNEDR